MFVILLFACALIAASINYKISKEQKNFHLFAQHLLKYLLFFNVGLGGLLGFVGHTFRADETAQMIGWPPGSPFQTEVAFSNLSYGILGLLSIRFHGLFWSATVIGSSIFLYCCFINHLMEYFQGNDAPYNIGVFIWVGDLLTPSILLTLLYLYQRSR
jgi:F0F1-type ATP synthase membrane subunit a